MRRTKSVAWGATSNLLALSQSYWDRKLIGGRQWKKAADWAPQPKMWKIRDLIVIKARHSKLLQESSRGESPVKLASGQRRRRLKQRTRTLKLVKKFKTASTTCRDKKWKAKIKHSEFWNHMQFFKNWFEIKGRNNLAAGLDA